MAIDSPINISGINGSISAPGIDGNRGGATKSYSFLTGVLSPDFTCPRASAGSYENSAGIITQAANNAPRFDYNPVSLAINGLLLEGQSTNLVPNNTNMLAGTWGTIGINASVSATLSPDGTYDAFDIIPTAGYGYHAIWSPLGAVFTIGNVYTASFYVKPKGYNFIQFGDANGFSIYNSVFDIQNGLVVLDLSGRNACSITPKGNGVFRCAVTFTAVNSTIWPNVTPGPSLAALSNTDAAQYTADGVSGATVYGMQVEAGSIATSLIITGSTAGTRMADSLINTSIPWFNAAAGTFVVEFIAPSVVQAYQSVAVFSDGSSNNKLEIFAGGSSGSGLLTINSGGNAYTSAGFTVTPSAIHKITLSYGPTVYGAIDGVAIAAIAGAVLPATINQLSIGSDSLGLQLNSQVRKFSYWNTQLSPSQILQATT
jgi:hypothetical protein